MNEGAPRQEEPVETSFERHETFFGNVLREGGAWTLFGLGSAIFAAGVYESITGHKVDDVIAAHADKIPSILIEIVNRISDMPNKFVTAAPILGLAAKLRHPKSAGRNTNEAHEHE